METIKVKQSTFLKQSPRHQAHELSDDNRVFLTEGRTIKLSQVSPAPEGHIKLTLATPIKGIITWYGYKAHFALEDVEESEEQRLSQPLKPLANTNIDTHIVWSNFGAKIGKYFTVGELLRYDPARIPHTKTVQGNIIKIVKHLDMIREEWGTPIGVTSGYRPSAINRAVGGVSNSQHLTGNAVDIYPVNGMNQRFERWLDENWFGALGYGQRNRRGFTHLDMRNGKGWKSGGAKGVRWDY